MKLLGSMFVLSGGAFLVFFQMAERRRRRETLGDMINALRWIADALRLTRAPLPQLLDQAAQERNAAVSAFFLAVSAGAKTGENVQMVWRQAAALLPLPPQEIRLLSTVAQTLYGDETSVCNGISLAICELGKCAESWDERRADDNKRTAALTLSGAALLVILLI